jgi:hypothetical protein
MQVPVGNKSSDYARAVAELVEKMPVERAAQVYDFARFVKVQQIGALSTSPGEDDDWLADSEEQMQAEDALWEATYAQHQDQFHVLAEEARAEIAAGTTQPMFRQRGKRKTK